MERNIRSNGLVNLGVIFIATACGLVMARHTGSLAGQVGTIFLAIGTLVALVSFFQMRLEASERLEQMELDELAKRSKESHLFQSGETELYPAKRSREQFERYVVPAFGVLLLALQAGGCWWSWQWIGKTIPGELKDPTAAMGLFVVFFLAQFLVGRYAVNISRMEKQPLLRPGAGYLLLGAYLCLAVAGGVCVSAFGGLPKGDLYLARVLAVLLGLSAFESLVTLLLEVYRPRVKGREARLLYDSRLIGLLGQPEGLFATAAHALDYQFGFKVSETWFYQLLRQHLGIVVLAQLAILLLSTCVVFIDPGEEAIRERFGQPTASGALLGPGAHCKWPWPIDRVYRYRTQQIQTFNIGFVEKDEHEEEMILWSVPHFEEEMNMLVASRDANKAASTNATGEQAVPANLLTVNIPVQYQVTNVLAWATTYANAAQLLENIATREAVRYLVNVDLNELMTTGRAAAAQDLRQRIQAKADEMNLGAKIIFVGMQGIHPPTPVAAAYEGVVAALQKKETKILEAQGYQARTVPLAQAEATKRVREAEAYRERAIASAEARSAEFTNRMAAFSAAPEVYAQRSYLQTLSRGSGATRKYVLAATNTSDVIILNLEDKLRPDLLDVAPAIPTIKTK